ncbi:unnamed protein product [Cochlearia groenlandica]
METPKNQTQTPPKPAMPSSCRKKKAKDDATFFDDVKIHIDEFMNASMDEHKSCFQKTINKMFGLSKAVAEKQAEEAKGVDIQLPLQTTVSD